MLATWKLIGDTAYGKAEMLGWLVDERGITPHIPVWDKSEENDELFGRSDFTWEAKANRYLCPGGKSLLHNRRKFKKKRSHITKAKTIIYRASKMDCDRCAMKTRCCPGEEPRICYAVRRTNLKATQTHDISNQQHASMPYHE